MDSLSLQNSIPKEKNSVDALNFLRVAATMFVFLLHGRSYVAGIDDGVGIFTMFTNMPAWAGVWILFFLSGYLLQKGFLKNRYPVFEGGKLRTRELFGFYLKRFLKIAPAYYIYILLFLVIRGSTYFFTSPLTALRILTFTFNGNGGISGVGHLWYISVAMWLYVLAPFFYYIIEKFKSTKALSLAFVLTVILGFALRNGLWFTDLAWYTYNYTFLPCNIDLFFGGMLACSLTERIASGREIDVKRAYKLLASLLFAAVVIINCYVYWQEIYYVYQYLLPTAYILSCSFLLWCFDSGKAKREKPTWNAIKRNPLRLIDRFSPITYAFYIFHICAFQFIENALLLWSGYAELSLYARYAIFMGGSFAVSLLIGVLFTKMIAVFGSTTKKKA